MMYTDLYHQHTVHWQGEPSSWCILTFSTNILYIDLLHQHHDVHCTLTCSTSIAWPVAPACVPWSCEARWLLHLSPPPSWYSEHLNRVYITKCTYTYTVKKENEIQMGSVAKSNMRKGFLKYEEMRKYLTIYEKAVSHIWLCNWSLLNFLIYEDNLILVFISVEYHNVCFLVRIGTPSPQIYCRRLDWRKSLSLCLICGLHESDSSQPEVFLCSFLFCCKFARIFTVFDLFSMTLTAVS